MVQKTRLFSVGDLNIDILQGLSSKPVFGEERRLQELAISIGGNAANFSVIGSKLGLGPQLISVIGKDFATRFLKKQLSEAGVKSSLIKSSKQNTFAIILVNKRGQRSIQSVKECYQDVTSKKFERLLLPKLRKHDIVFFGGFYHFKNLRPGFKQLLAKVKKRGATICFDTCFDSFGRWNINAFLPFIDYLFVNDLELKHIARGSSMRQRVESLFRKGARIVAVKQEARGATLFVKGAKPKHFPSVAGRVVDTTGAGDAFNVGFVFGLMRGWSLENCVVSGNFVAAKKIRVHGLEAPAIKAIERFVARNGRAA
jgi:ribokinase